MKKWLTLILMLLCVLTLLCACNVDDGNNPPAACVTHTWGSWETVTPATCGKLGAQKHTCTVCEASEITQIPATGKHNFVGDKCSECGAINVLIPMRIERTAFETKILKPLEENLSSFEYYKFLAYFSLKKQGDTGVAATYPVTEEKGIDIYVFNDDCENIQELRELEAKILEYTNYTFEELAADHAFVEYEW